MSGPQRAAAEASESDPFDGEPNGLRFDSEVLIWIETEPEGHYRCGTCRCCCPGPHRVLSRNSSVPQSALKAVSRALDT